MPPKVDPNEVRFSKFVDKRSQHQSIRRITRTRCHTCTQTWSTRSQCQESRRRYCERRRQMEGDQSHGAIEMPKQSC